MAFFGFLRKKRGVNQVDLGKKGHSSLQDAAVAMAFAEHGEQSPACCMTDREKRRQKILVIGSGDQFSQRLVDYAIQMAKRMDYEVISLNVMASPHSMTKDGRDQAIARFREACSSCVVSMKERAQSAGIAFRHLAEIGHQDEIVEKLHAEYPELCYVLTDPDPEAAGGTKGHADIPVFTLSTLQGSLA